MKNFFRSVSFQEFVHKNQEKIFWLILAAAGLIYIGRNPEYRTGFFNDDSLYVLVARDLWNTPAAHPLLQIKPDFPLPGLPLLLAPLARFVAPNWMLLEWFSLVATLISIFLLRNWTKKWMSTSETMIVVSLFAFNPLVAQFSGNVMPAAYFTMCVLGSFSLLRSVLSSPRNLKLLSLGVILGWGALLRAEGCVLLLSFLIVLGASRQSRKLIPILLIPLAGWIIFLSFWFWKYQTPELEYSGDIKTLIYFWTHHVIRGFGFTGSMLKVFLVNSLMSLRFSPGQLSSLYRVSIIVVILGGLLAGFRNLWSRYAEDRIELLTAGLFCGSYSLVHLFWHVAEPRYFIPLIPFVILFFVRGLSSQHFQIRRRNLLAWSTLLIFFSSYAWNNSYAIYESLWNPNPMKSPPWMGLKWLRQNTKPTDQAISNIAATIELYSKRHAISLIKANNVEIFIYLMKKMNLDYIVLWNANSITPGVNLGENPNLWMKQYNDWVRRYSYKLSRVFTESAQNIDIYRISAGPEYVLAFEKYLAASRDFNSGNLGRALQEINESIGMDKEMGSAHNLRGAIFLLQNKRKEAEEEFLKANELLPDSPASLVNLATLYHQQGNDQLSIDCLKKGEAISTANQRGREYREKVDLLQQMWMRSGVPYFSDLE